jgi:ABC-type Na+ efflux pump permease subunit
MILGFFLIRGSIEDDRRSRIGEILASTPLKRLTYLMGKLLGSVVFLSMLGLVVVSMAAVLQALHREAPFQPFQLAWPFILFTLPAIVFVSGLALFFEVVPGLRQWPGDVLFVLFPCGSMC